MKKLMFTAAVAAAMGAFAIESANTVGYTTRTVNNQYRLAGGQFEAVGGDTFTLANLAVSAPATVNAWVTYDETLDEFYDNVSGWDQRAPMIQIPDASGNYTPYYYIADTRDANDQNAGAGWANGGGYAVDPTITAGLGVWVLGYRNGDAAVADTTLTFSGEVNGDNSQNISLANGYMLRAVPYPKALALNGENVANWSVLTAVNAWVTYDETLDEFYDNVSGWDQNAPVIQIPDANGNYTPYYYVADARDGSDQNAGAGWVNGGGYLVDATIPVGTGIWFDGRKTVNVPIYK